MVCPFLVRVYPEVSAGYQILSKINLNQTLIQKKMTPEQIIVNFVLVKIFRQILRKYAVI